MFDPRFIKSPTRANTFNTGEARKRAAAEYYRRLRMTQAEREQEDANTEAWVKCNKWWLKNHERVADFLGGKEQAQRKWFSMCDAAEKEDPKKYWINFWGKLQEYDQYLTEKEGE